MLKIALHAYSSIEQLELQACLVQLVVDCQGWILEEKPPSQAACHLRFKVGLSNISSLYGAFQQLGLQLTPVAHRALTEMCLCQKHLPANDEVQIVFIDLHVATLEEEHIHFRRFVRPNSV